MPDRTRKGKRPTDSNRRAWEIVQEAVGEDDALREALAKAAEQGKNPAAVALGRLGGRTGGKARAQKLSAQERSDIARKAALARWKKKD